MKLKELNIVGFKSFAKKTNILMHDGITAIVGPNGCGKSNIVDAIRWVMGEQRTSALRSEKMDNVIFSGSASAKAVGMAEVSLRIENDDNRLPVDYSEVVITRRLFRSGESQYLINGNQCRLKDINDLFMDTGMTGQSYSVIELPQVDKILNGAPEERSRIFEEAAGSTKVKQRRRLTLRKLEATEKDLNRVNDILAEVEKKVRSLQRQVTKAQRYQELSEELKEQDIKLATHDYANLLNELEPLESKRNHLVDDREKVMASLSNRESDFESCKTKLLELEQKLTHEQTTFNHYYKNIQKFEERVLVNKERIRSLEEMQKRYGAEREHLVTQLNELEQDLDQANYENKRIKKDLDAAKEQYESLNTEYQSIRQEYDNKRAAFKDKEAEILYITEQISTKLNEGERLRATEESLSQRMQDIDSNVSRQKEHLQEISYTLNELKTSETDLTLHYEQVSKQHAQAEREANQEHNAAEGLRKTDLQDQNRIEVLENNAEMIRKVLENYQDYPSGVRYLATLKSDNFKSYGTVANTLHVDSGHRTAISAALGEAAAYLIVNNINDATAGIGLLQQERKGVVSFLPLEAIPKGQPEHPHIEDLGVVGWADQVVRCEDRFRPILDMLLAPFLIVQDLETANRIYETAAAQKVNLVTLAGEVLGHWGLVRGGSHSKRQSDFVGRQEELEQLQKEIIEIKQASERRQIRIQELESSEQKKRLQIAGLQEELKTLEQALSQKRVELGRVEYEHKSTAEAIEEQTREKQDLFNRVTQLGENLKTQDSTAQSLKEKRAVLANETSDLEQSVQDIEKETVSASEKVHNIQVKVAELSSEFNAAERQCDSVREQMQNTQKMIEQRDRENAQASEEIQDLVHVNEEYADRINHMQEKLEESRTHLDELKDEQYNVNVQTDEQEKEIRQLRKQAEQQNQIIHEADLRLSELRMKRDSLVAQIQEEYEFKLSRQPKDPDFDIAKARENTREIRDRIKKMGPVNLLALKEYEAEKYRLDFLSSQRDDLLKAKSDLSTTISIINNTAKEKLEETFKDIQTNFIHVFQNFFHGGRANLVLREGEDPLDIIVDIYAAPAGKKPASLQLLSGGEKSLTAVSLLFAIYLVKPSPFCIFDEVDAPLDDKNVQRFANALNELSSGTQFIIVTHNKLTMRAAEQLYGVTMEQDGVSKVVSVRFENAEQYAEQE